MKYHISPNTGRPNLCRAEVKDCPVGGAHYATKDEARAAYEKAMESDSVAPSLKKSNVKTTSMGFAPDEPVESVTVWSYSEIAYDAKALGLIQSANPELKFSSSPSDELVVSGPAAAVEAYIREPGGDPHHIEESLSAMRSVGNLPSPGPIFNEEGVASPDDDLFADFEKMGAWGDFEEEGLKPEELIADADDDYSSIKCEDCGNALSSCSCGTCEYCGAWEDEDHEDTCPLHRARPKAYSWD